MIILGIDPGYDRLGIAVLEKPDAAAGGSRPKAARETLLYSDCFQTSAKDPIYARFAQIGGEVSRIIEEFKPDALSIETLFISKNQKTAMRVSEARGIIIYEAVRHNLPVHEYGPMEIKMAVTGDGTSDKSRIIRMVQMLITIPPRAGNAPIIDDEYDAIAVALTHSALIHNFLAKK